MADAPAFQFYAADFLADGAQMVMELEEVGAYIRLMAVCWKEGSIPTDTRLLAKLAGCDRADMERIWPAIRGCFQGHPEEDGLAIHPRLEKEREKQAARSKKMSQGGKKGAHKRWKGKKTAEIPKPDSGQEPNNDATEMGRLKPGHSQAIERPMASDSSSVSFSSSGTSPNGDGRAPDVDNSTEIPEHTHHELLAEANKVLGLGLLKRPDQNSNHSILVQWEGRGRSRADTYAAIHGLRMMVDDRRPEVVEWLKPGVPISLKALNGTSTLYDQGDGKAKRVLYDVAAEYYRAGGRNHDPPRQRTRTSRDPMKRLFTEHREAS